MSGRRFQITVRLRRFAPLRQPRRHAGLHHETIQRLAPLERGVLLGSKIPPITEHSHHYRPAFIDRIAPRRFGVFI